MFNVATLCIIIALSYLVVFENTSVQGTLHLSTLNLHVAIVSNFC